MKNKKSYFSIVIIIHFKTSLREKERGDFSIDIKDSTHCIINPSETAKGVIRHTLFSTEEIARR